MEMQGQQDAEGSATGDPPGADRDLGEGRGQKRGGAQSWDTAEDAGM